LPQVGWITADGAAVNGTTIHEFEDKIDIANDGWTAQEHDILYVHLFTSGGQAGSPESMEYSLYIVSKHFVEAVASALLTSIREKVKVALVKAHNNGKLNFDEFDEALSLIDLENIGDQNNGDGGRDSNDDDNDNSDFTPGDSLGKALALVKQLLTDTLLLYIS